MWFNTERRNGILTIVWTHFINRLVRSVSFILLSNRGLGLGKSNTHPFSSCRAASKRPNGSFNRNSTQHGQAVTVLKFYSDWTLLFTATYLARIKSPPAFYKRNFQLAIVNLNSLNNFKTLKYLWMNSQHMEYYSNDSYVKSFLISTSNFWT